MQRHGFEYFEIEFDKNAGQVDPAEQQAVLDYIQQNPVTDLLVMSHGWNNNMDEARSLYDGLLSHLQGSGQNLLAGRNLAVLGVLWPSKKFTDQQLIPGGAAGFDPDQSLHQHLDKLADALGVPKEQFKVAHDAVANIEDSEAAQAQFVNTVRQAVALSVNEPQDVDGSESYFHMDPADMLDQLSKPSPAPPVDDDDGGGAAAMPVGTGFDDDEGGASSLLSNLFNGIKSGAQNLLNVTTYYVMKERAGSIGRKGLAPLLRNVAAAKPGLKIHLLGHSFGARLVTSAAAGDGQAPAIQTSSMTLLQAAFSHYGFAERWDGQHNGLFRPVLTNHAISGPVLISHTDNDTAVGLAYALASRLANQVASGLGDKNDKYGGLGRNGAQKTPGVVQAALLQVGQPYALNAGGVYNLQAGQFIKGHSDLLHPQVGYAIANAIAAT